MNIFLPSIILHSPGPILAQIGPLTMRWYGLLTALGFLAAVGAASWLLKYRKKFLANDHPFQAISEDDFMNFCIVALFSGILGARLWYVMLKWDFYLQNANEILQIWHGGQSIQGGMIGVLIGSILFSLFTRKGFQQLLFKLSLVASTVPLGQAIGRWGNFFNEEAFGKATDLNLPIKLFISKTGLFHHPTFLYEAIWNLINFGILIFLNLSFYSKNKSLPLVNKDLILISLYLIIYSTGRIVIETIRTDSLMLGAGVAARTVSITMIALGLIMLLAALIFKNNKR